MHALELDISRLDPKDRINPDDGQEAKSTTLAGSIVLEITKQRQLLCMSFGLPRAVLCWVMPLVRISSNAEEVWILAGNRTTCSRRQFSDVKACLTYSNVSPVFQYVPGCGLFGLSGPD